MRDTRPDLTRPAFRAVLAICRHICNGAMGPDNWPLWQRELREACAQMRSVTEAMAAIATSAEAVAMAPTAFERDGAMTRLRFELRMYEAQQAAAAAQELRDIRRDTAGGRAA